jgi:hypothetical protein
VARKVNGANEEWEGGEVYVVPYGPCGPPIFVLLEGVGIIGEWVPLGMVALLGA